MIKVPSEASQVLIAKVCEAGHEHVLRFWDSLTAGEKSALLASLEEIDFQLVNSLTRRYVKNREETEGEITQPRTVQPISLPSTRQERTWYQRLRKIGEEAITGGRVAVFLAAGLKKSFPGRSELQAFCPVGPVSQKTLIQLQCEKIAGLNRRYGVEIPFLIMTSEETEAPLKEFFKKNNYFNLSQERIFFLKQQRLPLLDHRGKLVMTSPCEIAMAPNGHGGAYLLLRDREQLDLFDSLGVEHVFYFQVDNPCVQVADPAFVGRHINRRAELSAKTVLKTDPDEQVGVFTKKSGHVLVIEYFDLPAEFRRLYDEKRKQLDYSTANISIHLFSVGFLKRTSEDQYVMPYHRIEQRTVCLDRNGKLVRPSKPNSTRFECHVFDVCPWSRKTALVETDRREEFYPVKTQGRRRSFEDIREVISEKYALWLERQGLDLPRNANGKLLGSYEIGANFALDQDEFREKCDASSIIVGDSLYLE